MKSLLICVTGIDGSGKTSLCQRVVARFREANLRAVYRHGLTRPLLLRPVLALGRRIFLRRRDRGERYVAYAGAKSRVFARHGWLSRLYRALLFVDTQLYVLAAIRTPQWFGYHVVCDRYYYDAFVNASIYWHLPPEQVAAALREQGRWFPTPSLAYWVDAPPQVAFGRKTDVPSIEYLQYRRSYFAALAVANGMATLDGAAPLERLEQTVMAGIRVKLDGAKSASKIGGWGVAP